MNIETALAALCEMLRSMTGAAVSFGRPDDTNPGIYLLPWRFWEDPDIGSPRVPSVPETELEHARSHPNIDLLVFASPVDTLEGIGRLDDARRAMMDHPVFHAEGTMVRVSLDPLAADDLLNIFSALGIPLTLCLCATLRLCD